MTALALRRHPAHAGPSTRLGRPRIGKASPDFLAGYNAALYAACAEGERVTRQSEPRGLQPDFLDGWRTAMGLCKSLGFRR